MDFKMFGLLLYWTLNFIACLVIVQCCTR